MENATSNKWLDFDGDADPWIFKGIFTTMVNGEMVIVQILLITQEAVNFYEIVWGVRCLTSNKPLEFGAIRIVIRIQEVLTEFLPL